MCSLRSLILYPKRAHSTSWMLPAKYWGPQTVHSLEQVNNHSPDSVALNYPCPASRLRVVSHNETKHREKGTYEQN
jgi:hypothetical protein